MKILYKNKNIKRKFIGKVYKFFDFTLGKRFQVFFESFKSIYNQESATKEELLKKKILKFATGNVLKKYVGAYRFKFSIVWPKSQNFITKVISAGWRKIKPINSSDSNQKMQFYNTKILKMLQL